MSRNNVNIIFVTSNKEKIREVKQILGDSLPIKVICYDTDLLEFQSSNPDDITRAKCIEAIRTVGTDEKWIYNNFKLPSQSGDNNSNKSSNVFLDPRHPTFIMIEDTGLNFDAWGGLLPGPYVKWFCGVIGSDGLSKTLQAFPNKNATAVCTFALYLKPSFIYDIFNKLSNDPHALSKNDGDHKVSNSPGHTPSIPNIKETNVDAINSPGNNITSQPDSSSIVPTPSNNGAIHHHNSMINAESLMNFDREIPSVADIYLFKGTTRGIIVPPRLPDEIQVKKGAGGFGWDSCFEPDAGPNTTAPPGSKLTYAQMTAAQKNSISHRCKSLINLRNFLIKKYLS